ncbi:hypothetical protein ACQKGI_15280, partial [Peribacillus muralis]|uniref:hypothetical protein n=1 Tax=Peribacillus muralis TaxID=264697 RepID=UPI003D05C800
RSRGDHAGASQGGSPTARGKGAPEVKRNGQYTNSPKRWVSGKWRFYLHELVMFNHEREG